MRITLPHDDRRAVTPAVTHVLTIAFTSILIVGLMIGAGGYLDDEEQSSARQELDAIGNRLADEIDRVDNLAQQGSRVSITTQHPEEVSGGGYTVSHEHASVCGLSENASCLVLESHETDATVHVNVVNETAISLDRMGNGKFTVTADEPTSTAAIEGTSDSGGLDLRVGVAGDIREDPLGSRLIERNVPPIALFDVEPQPVTTAESHWLNGTASLDQDGNVSEHKWDIGDDGLYTEAGELASHWFDGPGRHEVTLRVADDARDTASTKLTKNVTVSGLEYNHDLREAPNESIRFSLTNNWTDGPGSAGDVRLDSLFIDDLNNSVDELGNCDDDPSWSGEFNSEINIDVDSDGDRETYIEYDDADLEDDFDHNHYDHHDHEYHDYWDFVNQVDHNHYQHHGGPTWDCNDGDGVAIPDPGLTIDVDQKVPGAHTSSPDTSPVVEAGETATIQISGLDSSLQSSDWRLGVSYNVQGERVSTETVFADRVGAPHVSDFTMDGSGDELTVSFTSVGELEDIGVDISGPDPATIDEGTFNENLVGGNTFEYTATLADRESGEYLAELTQAETASGVAAFDLPLRDYAVSVDESTDAVWTTSTDWDNVTVSEGIVHETFGDHQGSQVGLGYPWNDTDGTNLTAYWAMDDDGSGMEDVSFDGTNDGDTTDIFDDTVGLFGTSSYAFDGASSVVDGIDSTNQLSGGGDETFTVSTWVHPREAISNSNGAAVIAKLNSSSPGGDWSIVMNDSCPSYATGGCDGTPTIGYYGGSATNEYALLHGPVTKPDAWHHVAFVFDGKNDELDLYYDGRIVESVDSVPDYASMNTSRNVRIGHHPGTGQTFDGYIDETRIYNRALTGAQIQRLADTSIQGTFTTDWQNTSSAVAPADLNLSAATELNDGSVTVRIRSDEGELSDPIRLTEDDSSYVVTGLSTPADGYRLEVTAESGSKNLSPIIDSLVVHERP